MSGIAVTHKRLMVAAARANRASPTGMAIVFRVDVAAAEKVPLLLAVHARGDMAECMLIRIDETVARRNVAGGTDADQAQTGPARVRLADALMQLSERIANVGEAVHLAAQGKFEVLVRQDVELIEYAVHAAVIDRVQAVG